MNILAIPEESIQGKIYLIRGEKVMIDADLAMLYGVKTKVLIQSVKRNAERFPIDFMFKLSEEEAEILKSQFVTSSWGGRRYLPYAFTEQGIAMLSSVLHSPRAVQVNISIMRAFVKLRKIMTSHEDLRRKIEAMESKYDKKFKVVFDVIKTLIFEPVKKSRKIGFLADRRGESHDK